ncbi:RNA polymerase sigma factor [Paenibacillus sp. J45TS6]|uniref:RNA polymerase sigma factor n=1 Tax=Paenibacillus polygoni TaxID=3050112 RepID=A0ABY8X4Y1_9BACL|nr:MULTISPECIES: RNA polymerase sigma factor [Paenibacillus]WIV19527.1 RNA polymerase sigma factor [Paenibacillus polygoni]GIP44294.1 RNA polymerase sigma factor [Paenibacillus sp. J45TS6]
MDYSDLKHAVTLDNDTLYQIMDDFGNDVWNYAFFLTGSRDHADDISQEVFIKAYQGIHTYRGEASLKTWLITITRNTVHSYRRSRFFRQSLGSKLFSIDDEKTAESSALSSHSRIAPSAESIVMEQHYEDSIWEIIMSLSVKSREVLILALKYEMKIHEIAKILHISEGTVKSRLSRAKEKVQKELGRRAE